VARYAAMIEEAARREIDRWRVGAPLALAPRMQAVTLDVIMAGIFGIEGRPARGSVEDGLRRAVRRILALSTMPGAKVAELVNLGRNEPVGALRAALAHLDGHVYAVIGARRAERGHEQRTDVLSILLEARAEDGAPLSDRELRDELLTLVLAGHETTANSLAWTFERVVRTPAAYDRLRESVRSGDGGEAYVEASIHEGVCARPVIPVVGRSVRFRGSWAATASRRGARC
jgi:cytochrome P450